MRVLCLSDLHMYGNKAYELSEARKLVKNNDIDVIVISGDIYDDIYVNPYEQLSTITDKPIVCTFGNHEIISFGNVDKTFAFYQEKYNPNKYNVHYLDIIGNYEIDNIRFIGNVLWYDGSLKDVKNQSDTDIIYNFQYNGKFYSWLDRRIKDFNFKLQNERCVRQIKNNLSKCKNNFLVTHCVPHKSLNLFSLEGISPFNMYSGMKDLLIDLKENVKWSVCGHTHRRTNNTIYDIQCVNVGNDYSFHQDKLLYYIFDI